MHGTDIPDPVRTILVMEEKGEVAGFLETGRAWTWPATAWSPACRRAPVRAGDRAAKLESTVFASVMQQGGYMWYGDGHMVGMHWAWWIFWIAVVGVLAWSLLQAAGKASDGRAPPRSRRSPEQILRERFAEGEISEEEFRKRLDLLRESDEA